jgi:hypothetical protein
MGAHDAEADASMRVLPPSQNYFCRPAEFLTLGRQDHGGAAGGGEGDQRPGDAGSTAPASGNAFTDAMAAASRNEDAAAGTDITTRPRWVYEVFLLSTYMTKLQHEAFKLFKTGITRYRGRKWREAHRCFEEAEYKGSLAAEVLNTHVVSMFALRSLFIETNLARDRTFVQGGWDLCWSPTFDHINLYEFERLVRRDALDGTNLREVRPNVMLEKMRK